MKKFLHIYAFILLILAFAVSANGQKKTQVVVLSTLHQFHSTNTNYSFEALAKTIERIKPDVLAVELTAKDLESRREQKVKIEYANSVFPLLDKYKYKTVALEPNEPLYSELINLLKESNKENQEKFPQKVEAFSNYSNALYDYLFKYWTSIEAVNSSQTDALFEIKHNFQNSLFGEKEAKVWNDWNSYFLKQIKDSAAKNKGKRILVLVGAEHSYWLRKNLQNDPEINLFKIKDLL
jgi:pheromone shutdown protein TraB